MNKKESLKRAAYVILFLLLFYLIALSFQKINLSQQNQTNQPVSTNEPVDIVGTENPSQSEKEEDDVVISIPADSEILRVTFLDVGNADCEIIQLPNGQNMIIDAGENDDGKDVVKYLQSLGISKIDYVVGTHPHADHIGGLDDVIDSFEIGKVYLPRIPDKYAPSTKTYLSVLEAIQKKGLRISSPKKGDIVYEDEFTKIQFLNEPNEDLAKDNMNRYSLVVKVTYGLTSFLFTGDAEIPNETEILKDFKDEVDSDVLKIGHHGSRTSSSQEWLDAVSPSIIYIPCGKDNDYGHPHKETMEKLSKMDDVSVYRADIDGTVTLFSDGIQILKTEN
jgi:beta-lactamase superfamily II metal-dependent hydrolase